MSNLKNELSRLKSRKNNKLDDEIYEQTLSVCYVEAFVYYLTPRRITLNHKSNRDKRRPTNKNIVRFLSIYDLSRLILNNKSYYSNYSISNDLLFLNKFHAEYCNDKIARSSFMNTFKRLNDTRIYRSKFGRRYPSLSFNSIAMGINARMNSNYNAEDVQSFWQTIIDFNNYYR